MIYDHIHKCSKRVFSHLTFSKISLTASDKQTAIYLDDLSIITGPLYNDDNQLFSNDHEERASLKSVINTI